MPAWIPRELNEIADYMSKYNDTDSWGIDFETFEFIHAKYGQFTIDRFADDTNRKTKSFNSKFYCPNSMGVNAFTFNLSGQFNWLCPPISLIGEVIIHTRLCKTRGVLLIPKWESSYFWPLLTKDGISFLDFVKDFLLIDPFYLNYSQSRSTFEGFTKLFIFGIVN